MADGAAALTEPSSNLGRMGSTVTNALLAKWSRQPPSKREIPGSNPGWGTDAYIPAGIGSGECALPSFRRFESSCKHMGARETIICLSGQKGPI